ncbi:MAG TPA: LysE family translocator [Gaiellaceae bacterium]|nr:LysE family translocator [Gaiellaceae bacterium]
MPNLAAFLVVATIVIVTPGPDTALTIRNTLLGGRRGGVLTAIGVATGQTTWTVATSAGLAALLVASEPVFRSVRFIGAAYLAFLGIEALRAARRGSDSGQGGVARGTRALTPSAALRQGLISNLTNPKMIAFFPALLPQFAPAGRPTFLVLLLLGLLFSSMTLVWLTAYALVVAKAGDFLRQRRVRRLLEAATGIVLIALGLRLATEPR